MIIDRTEEPLMKLTIGRSRRSDCSGTGLAQVHRDVGRLLAPDVARTLPLEEIEIEHVAGRSIDVRMVPGTEPVVIAMLRSGLYLAEGVREALCDATFVLHGRGDDVATSKLEGRVVVIVDAVINTGRSLEEILTSVVARAPRRVVIVSLVGYRPTVERLAREHPDVDFVLGRVSDRSYVGKGGTDTGARLFGTVGWE